MIITMPGPDGGLIKIGVKKVATTRDGRWIVRGGNPERTMVLSEQDTKRAKRDAKAQA